MINQISQNSENTLSKLLTAEVDSNLASEKNLISINRTLYEFKEEPIQLVISSEGMLETTSEAINILTALKNEKLCILSINGPISSGKSIFANNIINNKDKGFKTGEKTEGIWIWGKPITLNNGAKLLILDCQGLLKSEDQTSHKLFILSVLLSTSLIYNTKGDLTDDIINDFIYFADLSEKVNIQTTNEDKLKSLENLRQYFPELIFINNNYEKEKIEELIEKNPQFENLSKLFENIEYYNTGNYIELIDKIKSEMKYKALKNNNIDGEQLFGLLQNYIDFLNNGENPVINSALENVLLSKAKNESDLILEEFKTFFNKKIEYPMSITIIFKIFLELQRKYSSKFSKKVDKILTPSQTGEYIKKLFTDMEKELDASLETNKDYYDEWFGMEYKELEEVLSKINLESLEKSKLFILSLTSTLQTCLNKFLNIPNTEFCKNLMTILSKIFQELFFEKLNSFGEQISNMYENNIKDYNINIENLNNEIKKLNEQIDNNRKILNDKNKEKNESNKNFLELENKLDKLNREIKDKEKEYENNLNIEIQKYQKMEEYYSSQIKEKEQIISNLESKIENLNNQILGSNKESIKKENELNIENLKLQNQIEQLKKNDSEGGSSIAQNGDNLNLQTLFRSIQDTFMQFKESIDKLDKENENVFKTKFFENSTKEFEEKINISIIDVKNFCEKQVKELVENYEKEIKKIKDEFNEINFELSKRNVDINEQTKLKEVCETKLKESVKQIDELNEISK